MVSKATARARLIEAAAEIFYDGGLPSIGINQVTAQAGVARMTLYNNFDSKQALALAAFEWQAEARRASIEECLCRARTAPEKIASLFDIAEKLASEPSFRGCAFINLAAQDLDPSGPLHALVRARASVTRRRAN